jgi:hypothetical protein
MRYFLAFITEQIVLTILKKTELLGNMLSN